MTKKFEGIKLIPINAGHLRHGAAVTIPGIGIISGKTGIKQRDLLRHEFGHILQFREWGFIFYWFRIAPASLLSARKANKTIFYKHMGCWTEWSANLLSYHYFKEPLDWDFVRYPIQTTAEDINALPKYLRHKINSILKLA